MSCVPKAKRLKDRNEGSDTFDTLMQQLSSHISKFGLIPCFSISRRSWERGLGLPLYTLSLNVYSAMYLFV